MFIGKQSAEESVSKIQGLVKSVEMTTKEIKDKVYSDKYKDKLGDNFLLSED